MIIRKLVRQSLVAFSLVGFACASQFAMAASDTGTLVPNGIYQCTGDPMPYEIFVGYQAGSQYGTYSPTTLTGGYTIAELMDVGVSGVTCDGIDNGVFSVSGFSSNPGSSWLTSVNCGGVEQLASNASFGYSSGTASWTWNQSPFDFEFEIGDQISCTIVHN
jgi:hypothetical protein